MKQLLLVSWLLLLSAILGLPEVKADVRMPLISVTTWFCNKIPGLRFGDGLMPEKTLKYSLPDKK